MFTFVVVLFFTVGSVAAFREPSPAVTTLATFNTALVPFYPGLGDNGGPELEDRLSLLVEEIEKSDVDIICLQEVFFADFQRQIYSALRDSYPHTFSAIHLAPEEDSKKEEEMACDSISLGQLQACAQSCGDLTSAQLTSCIVLSCPDVISSFSDICRYCVILNMPTSTRPIASVCQDSPASRYESSYGLMLLSRKELKNTRVSGFNHQSQFRGYIEASVDGVGDLVCTHLTALLSTEDYTGPPVVAPLLYNTYEEQQYNEIITLFGLLANKDIPILMGDFNHGPASPGNITWELPFHYGLISARGFVSPYLIEDGRCTWCIENPTTLSAVNLVIDHIYLPTDISKERTINSERFLDDSRVKGSDTPLSDHYGVKATLKDVKFDCRWWHSYKYYCIRSSNLQSFLELAAPQSELTRLCAVVNN